MDCKLFTLITQQPSLAMLLAINYVKTMISLLKHTLLNGPGVALVCSNWSTSYLQPKAANVTDHTSKEDESESLHTTLVLFSANDEFTTKQDMCLCCGSFGKGPEGQLIMCSQCGQSYHPYCVGVKVLLYSYSKGKIFSELLLEWIKCFRAATTTLNGYISSCLTYLEL